MAASGTSSSSLSMAFPSTFTKARPFGLVGESGSGKTTIGRAIIRINPMSDGEVI